MSNLPLYCVKCFLGAGEGVSRLQRCHFLRWKPWLLNSLRLFCRTSAFPRPPSPPRQTVASSSNKPHFNADCPQGPVADPGAGLLQATPRRVQLRPPPRHIHPFSTPPPGGVSGATRAGHRHPGLPQSPAFPRTVYTRAHHALEAARGFDRRLPAGVGRCPGGERGPSMHTLTSGALRAPPNPGLPRRGGGRVGSWAGRGACSRCLATRGQ